MVKIKSIILLLCIILSCVSCKTIKYSADTLEKLKWLEGKWEYEDGSIQYMETWKYMKDVGLNGNSKIVFNGEVLYLEDIEIRVIDGQISFKSKANIYKEESEFLLLSKVNSKHCVFSNSMKDRIITYKREKTEQLEVIMKEKQDGKLTKTTYLMHKKQ